MPSLRRRNAASCWLTVVVIGSSTFGVAVADTNPPVETQIPAEIRSFFKSHCVDCHQGDEPKGDLRLDRLPVELSSEVARRPWRTTLKRLEAGEMPPKEQPQPNAAEIAATTEWIRETLQSTEATERAREGRVTLRRLNRVEYENTVCELLGIKAELRKLLPLDSSSHGFDNVGDALHTSSFLMDRYLEAAQTALDAAIANYPRPPLIEQRYSLTETHQLKSTTENVFRKSEDGRVVMFSSSAWQSVSLTPFYPPDRGDYRFRISTSGVQSAGRPVTYRVDAGLMLMTGKPHLVGYFDAPAGETQVVEFVESLEARDTIRISPYGLAHAVTVDKIGAEKYDGPGLAIDWIDVEGPLHETWPPESHRRIFGDLPQANSPSYHRSDRVEVVSENPSTDAARIVKSFAGRAFRRPVTDEDVQPFIALVETKLADEYSFEQAVRVGLAAVLMSPDFLYLRETPGHLDDHALASRLSYFLWSGPPDNALLQAADTGKLAGEAGRAERHAQVERMLNDNRSRQFIENFVGQWLGLRDIDFTEPSVLLYPEFDEMLKASMVREVELFFAEILKDDLSISNFVASDFTMLNGRLAQHYGIAGVEGWEFRKTALPADSHRGGVLTTAGVLKVTANGTSTSPVMRGAWVLERILGITPPRPPANVPALEPDIRGATTIREQLAKHREIADCAACHAQIDPPGFALESFDVIGGWRDQYRFAGWRRDGKELMINGRKVFLDLDVDPSAVLPDGRAFQNVDEFKRLLLADPDQLARALTVKLITYATGGSPSAIDQAEVDAIVARVKQKNHGFRSLIHEIVQSELFLTK